MLEKLTHLYISLKNWAASKLKSPVHCDDINNQLIVYRLKNGSYKRIEEIQPCGAVEQLGNDLIQKPSVVMFEQKFYDLTETGIYRFYRLNKISEQRFVTDEKVETYLNCVGYLWSYGYPYHRRKLTLAASKIHKKIFIDSCGGLSNIADQIAKSSGIKSRIVHFISSGYWGGQDDGHVMLELCDDNGDWFAYDPSFSVIFLHNGVKLNALQLQLINFEKKYFEIKKLPGTVGHSQFQHSNYDYGFWLSERFQSEDALMKWYKKILGIAILFSGDEALFCSVNLDSELVNRMTDRQYNVRCIEEFMLIFYEERRSL